MTPAQARAIEARLTPHRNAEKDFVAFHLLNNIINICRSINREPDRADVLSQSLDHQVAILQRHRAGG